MCGIAGFVVLTNEPHAKPSRALSVMGDLIAHRGPDGSGTWLSKDQTVGLTHRRLSIIDLSNSASQPMKGDGETVIVFNGEIYNYLELRAKITNYRYQNNSDTESILSSYQKWGTNTSTHLRGMFSYAIWDERKSRLFLSRDRFGIKPLYYTIVDGVLYFASETKALLPFLKSIATDPKALAEYLTFQYTIGDQTLFEGIKQLLPAHNLIVENGNVTIERYWDVQYEVDYEHNEQYFIDRTKELLTDSVEMHLRSDVEVGAYISGGIDSSLIGIMAAQRQGDGMKGFHGRFMEYDGYDESDYGFAASKSMSGDFRTIDITAKDFEQELRNVIYHLDYPVAGPGSFPQYMVSQLASESVKVVLGGQGGDEIFGGYARYLIAYFEQCIKAAIDGTYRDGKFVVTIESIIPNLGLLREYKPLLQEFWRDGLFGPLDERFFRLIDRSNDMKDEIDWNALDITSVKENFSTIFNNRSNVKKEAYFDSMTHFEFKTLLPALLQVEDRMSMAHGLESRVPLLDHPLVEFAATVPADMKFPGGQLKYLLKSAFVDLIPSEIFHRRDKMGFPVPLKEWMNSELSHFASDVFANAKAANREYINSDAVLANFANTGRYSRKTWALLSLEIWQQEFHDRASHYKSLAQ